MLAMILRAEVHIVPYGPFSYVEVLVIFLYFDILLEYVDFIFPFLPCLVVYTMHVHGCPNTNVQATLNMTRGLLFCPFAVNRVLRLLSAGAIVGRRW